MPKPVQSWLPWQSSDELGAAGTPGRPIGRTSASRQEPSSPGRGSPHRLLWRWADLLWALSFDDISPLGLMRRVGDQAYGLPPFASWNTLAICAASGRISKSAGEYSFELFPSVLPIDSEAGFFCPTLQKKPFAMSPFRSRTRCAAGNDGSSARRVCRKIAASSHWIACIIPFAGNASAQCAARDVLQHQPKLKMVAPKRICPRHRVSFSPDPTSRQLAANSLDQSQQFCRRERTNDALGHRIRPALQQDGRSPGAVAQLDRGDVGPINARKLGSTF